MSLVLRQGMLPALLKNGLDYKCFSSHILARASHGYVSMYKISGSLNRMDAGSSDIEGRVGSAFGICTV